MLLEMMRKTEKEKTELPREMGREIVSCHIKMLLVYLLVKIA
jgi:hypothetical protein